MKMLNKHNLFPLGYINEDLRKEVLKFHVNLFVPIRVCTHMKNRSCLSWKRDRRTLSF